MIYDCRIDLLSKKNGMLNVLISIILILMSTHFIHFHDK